MKTGLVLEGGGLRGMYTVGVLDAMLDHAIKFDYCIGVSAGACNGVSFVAGQRGRNKKVNLNYIHDPQYISLKNYIKTKSLFGMEYIFDEIGNHLEPFDYEAFEASPCEFVAGVTDAFTGRAAYFDKSAMDHDTTVLKASSSIPAFAPPVRFRGRYYLDGGTSAAIPFEKALEDGCDRLVVVLTRDRDYVKKPEGIAAFYKNALKDWPEMVRALENRPVLYRQQQQKLRELEKQGKALVIAPKVPLQISRFERNLERLEAVCNMGYEDMVAQLSRVQDYLKK